MANAAEPFDTLLIAASFFGYAKEIGRALERRGRKVLWFEDRPSTDTLTKALVRVAPRLMAARAEDYFKHIERCAGKFPIRDVFVIKGEALSVSALRHFRKAFPGARFTLYFWDSYRNMPGDSARKVALFDRAFTFDPQDAAADRRLRYRPLFYLDEYSAIKSGQQDIDVLFMGTCHTDRYSVLKRLGKCIPADMRFVKILYAPSRALYRARAVCDPAFWRRTDARVVFSPLSKAEVMGLISRSRIVVDIERPVQSGYTMRMIEMLGAKRKVITTNPAAAQADFYCAANIAVIDRFNPRLEDRFLLGRFEPLPSDLLERYSLTGWIDEVFYGKEPVISSVVRAANRNVVEISKASVQADIGPFVDTRA